MCKSTKLNILLLLLLFGFTSSFKLLAQTQTEEISDKNIKFLSFKPANYDSKQEHPLLIFLHGMGEKGSDLNLVKRNGPPKLIDKGQWPSDRPFIVISPQLPSNYGNWPPTLIDDLLEYVKTKYKVDNTRIYVTGLSLGGNGAWMYATTYPEKVAATVPICGWGAPHLACQMKDVPAWAFHGDADGTVNISGSINMVNGINACIPGPKVPAKLTVYPGVSHDSWTRTYDGSAGHDIYSWMLNYTNQGEVSKPNAPPTVSAGGDKILTLPENSVSISGTASDSDGSIASYTWTKTSGPNATLQNTNQAQLLVSDMSEGEYLFKLSVKDNDGASASDDIKVTVNAASNAPPTVSAGGDKILTLPENSVSISGTASDSDGSIASYTWTKTSGPNATLQNTNQAQLLVSDMSEGEYIFKLSVKDNDGASASDDIKVTVNAASNNSPTVFAGSDKILTLPENSVSISGAASDSDGSIASYTWTKTSGPNATLQNTDQAQLLVSDMSEGEYIFKLSVKDNDGASAADDIKVTVNAASNNSPTVFAGSDKILTLPENSVSISGAASDSDGSIASYIWTKTSGPNATLQNTDQAQLLVSDMSEGEYIFKLSVKDNDGASASDDIKVTVNAASNNAPTVFAGGDKILTLPENSVSISGAASDSDGSIASYTWTKTSGPNATLQNTDQAQLLVSDMSEGEYIFKLSVKDNDGASASDDIKVTVNAASNNAPTVFAGGDKILTLPENSVSISGAASDSDGSIASYIWTKTSGPNATLQNTDQAQLLVSDMSEGEYIFKLSVKDNDGASASDDIKVTVNAASNNAPTVFAGSDKILTLPENSVSISGAASDSNGSIASYIWTKTSGPNATLQNTDQAQLLVSDMSEGEYIFKLSVKDNDGASASDDIKITVNAANKIPTVSAGEDKVISLPENSITLNGSASDSDGSITSYRWTKTSGPASELSGTDNINLSLSNLVAGSYSFKLTVTDNQGATASDEVKVRVNNPPSANAGYDKNITLPAHTLLLSGAGSDSDGTITSYQWNKISGGNVLMKDEKTHLLSLSGLEAGHYEFELIVKDNNGASASDRVKVTVNPADNINPIAFAGEDITIKLPENSVMLSGNGSDEDGTIISYKWTQISGEKLELGNTNSTDLFLINLLSGIYEFEFSITDDKGATAFDKVKVTVEAQDIVQPIAIAINKQDLSCFGESTGFAEAVVSGGTSPYKFNWSNGSSESSIGNLTSGVYDLTVTDANEEKATSTITIQSPDKIQVSASVSNERAGTRLGSIEIQISGGTAPYQTKWLVNNTDAPNLQGNRITDLKASSYTILVTDANGCTAYETYTVSKKGNNSIAVYPNPSEGSFKVAIDASGGAYDLSIIDSKGKIIHKESGKQDDSASVEIKEYDLQSEGRGIYFVKVQYELGTFSINRVIIK